MTRVLTEVTRVKLLERLHSVLMIHEEVDESIKLLTCVLAVVPDLAVLAFPLSVRKSSTTASMRTMLHASVTFFRSIAAFGPSNRVLGCSIWCAVGEGGEVDKSTCPYWTKHE
ncbi:hypothetical protein C451_01748 [Halococcus thailandensis JCM 13552]|uniref:Uncharacterized protein n=1 Tax=Halococcus thailandensis JCM 13552 TaxID=1227457 RepID=M0NF32_9EURY|nr:hypothetical protein C451_01748 [Halococcus thailandensis JCM 13552]